ncbi:MAG: LacI family transcriptional regulator [Propionibacteriaceae bacterium]|jgi:DNA-binding LacI/PurR family transcriptional regulator|nr:LacI family transcriptional regulator [Propionibacteriaceae bacterium]
MAQVPTQEDVARAAGVSRGLVSLALADSSRVADATKKRILEAADRLGYVRNLGAASLASNRSPVVGVLLPDLRNPFFEDVVDSLQRNAEPRGLVVLVATASNDRQRERAVMRRFRELRAMAVVLVSPGASARVMREYARQVPVVTLGLARSGGLVDAVHVDEATAGRLVAARLRALDVSELLHLALDAGRRDSTIAARRDAVEAAARAEGLAFRCAETMDGALAAASAARPRELGIVAHNDLEAIALVSALRLNGLSPGPSLPVVGFDDTYLAAMPEFGLTSVSQDPDALGVAALDLALRRLDEPGRPGVEVIVQPRLTLRATA